MTSTRLRAFNRGGAIDPMGDADLVYLNAEIISNRTIQAASDPRAYFNEVRDSPIIKDSSKYEFSIIRASVNGPGLDIPIFEPQIQTGSGVTSVNNTVYSVTLEADVDYGTTNTTLTSSQQYLQWTPENLNAATPLVPTSEQDLSTDYYHCYTYNHVVDMVNTALTAAHTELVVDYDTWINSLGATGALSTRAPKMVYDSGSNLFSLYGDVNGFGVTDATSYGTTTAEDVNIYFNSNMYNLFSSFQTTNQNTDGALGKNHKVIFKNKNGTNIEEIATGVTSVTGTYDYKMVQDYPSTSTFWSPVASLVFTTTLIPVKTEFIGNPITFGNDNTNGTHSSSNNFQNIVTDIAMTDLDAHGHRELVSYAPSAEYRMITLSPSQQVVQNIDLQLFWRRRLSNELVPVLMPNLSTVDVKMLFRKLPSRYV